MPPQEPEPGTLTARTRLPLGAAVANVLATAAATWTVSHLYHDNDSRVEALEREVRDLKRGLEQLQALVMSGRQAGNEAIRSAIRRLSWPRDFTRESVENARPMVAAVQRELDAADVDLVPTRAMVDRVWYAMPLYERKRIGGRGEPAPAVPGQAREPGHGRQRRRVDRE